MKNFKRIQAMFLAVIMAVMTIGTTTAFAAERSNIARRLFIEGYNISTTSSAAGQSFELPSNASQILFEVRYSNSNTIIAVRLHDQTTGEVKEWQTSTGKLNVYANATAGHRYIFEYLVASGSGTIHVSNTVYAVFRN